jgi:hypothetical protein
VIDVKSISISREKIIVKDRRLKLKIENKIGFFGKLRKRGIGSVDSLVIHESDAPTAGITERALLDRKLSIHYIIDEDGDVTQYAEHTEICQHAAPCNSKSIGIELAKRVNTTPFSTHVVAPWLPWRRCVSMPEEAQMESLASLVDLIIHGTWIDGTKFEGVGFGGLYVRDGAAYLPAHRDPEYEPGILAHCYWHHDDGALPVIALWLMQMESMSLSDSYDWIKKHPPKKVKQLAPPLLVELP